MTKRGFTKMSVSAAGEHLKQLRAVAEERFAAVADKYELRKRYDTSKAKVTAVVEPYQAQAVERYSQGKTAAVERVAQGKQEVYTWVSGVLAWVYGWAIAVLVWAVGKAAPVRAVAEGLVQDHVPRRVVEGAEWAVGVVTVRVVTPLVRWADEKFLRGHVFRRAVPAARRVIDDVQAALRNQEADKGSQSPADIYLPQDESSSNASTRSKSPVKTDAASISADSPPAEPVSPTLDQPDETVAEVPPPPYGSASDKRKKLNKTSFQKQRILKQDE